jgi:cobalt-zinc-cadmium efflux system outer membrane protein
MHLPFSRRARAALIVSLAMSAAAAAQGQPTLAQAAEAAWLLSPQARSLESRKAELDARARAAASFLPGPPSVSLAHKAGRGAASGATETEAEISVPIWQPRLRSATAAQVDAERAALDAQIAAAKLKVASEARELAAQASVALVEGEAARRKAEEFGALASDLARRVKAGESSRLDLLRAQSEQRSAQAAASQAEGALARALSSWRALTGLAQPATLDERRAQASDHPLILAAEAQARAARAKLSTTEADRRDPMEVGVGVVRERPGGGAPTENALRISLRVPLGGDVRNGSRIAAARAEVDAAEAELDAARRVAAAEREAAEAELGAAERSRELAIQREQFAVEAQALVAKSYRLGESDLPTRLRADAERFEAEVARARAVIEARRALSKVNQSNGAMP